MSIFEKLGIILRYKEKVIKKGEFRGRVLEGVTSDYKLKMTETKGEIILTNKRIIIIGTNPLGKRFFPDIDFRSIYAIHENKYGQLVIVLNFGTLFEAMVLKIDKVSEWIQAIREQCVRYYKEKEERKDIRVKQKKNAEA